MGKITIDGEIYGLHLMEGITLHSVTAMGSPLPLIGRKPDPAAADRERASKIAEHAKEYEDSVRRVLRDVRKSLTARAIIAEIGRQRHDVTIVPWRPLSDANPGGGPPRDGNWIAAAKTASDRQPATRKRLLLRDKNKGNRPLPSRERGTGRGGDATVSFITPHLAEKVRRNSASTPGVAKRTEPKPDIDLHGPGTLHFEDEVLVHELVHAMMQVAGESDPRGVPRQPRYDSFSEFTAIVIANIYRSECGRQGVRNDNHQKLDMMFVGGEGFLQLELNRAHVRKIRRRFETLTRQIKDIDTYFNPFRHLRAWR